MNVVKPSVRMLPMEDIAKELNESFDFQKKGDKTLDTENVAGKPAEQIALSVSIEDRNTVLNAQNLGGVPAEGYVTNEDAASIINFTGNASETFAGEIRSLRDELYQMKHELTRNGYLNDYAFYEGFHDLFRIGNNILTTDSKFTHYLASSMDVDTPHLIQTQGNAGLVPGEWLIAYSKPDPLTSTPELRKLIQVKSYDGSTLEIDQPLPFILNKDYANLIKIQGQYARGGYTFSQTKNEFPTGDKFKVILVDDYNIKPFLITAKKTGYATNFKIPNSATGALIDLTIRTKQYGTPGSLTCKIYKGSASPSSVTLTTLVGQSTITNYTGTTATFSFAENDGTYPKLDPALPGDTNSGWYCFVVEAETADTLNYWELSFSYKIDNKIDSDLQTNNTSFAYVSPSTLNSVAVNPYDMYFELTTQKIAINPEIPFNEGLYTAEFKLPQPIDVSRARLTMRVNREGNWVVKAPLPGNPTDTSKQIFIEKAMESGDTYSGPDMGFRTDDIIAVGSFIRKLTNAIPLSNSLLTLDEGVYLPIGPKSMVHRIGYRVFLKAWREDWDVTARNFIPVTTAQCIELPISIIFPDGIKPDLAITDRLVFEQEIGLLDSNNNPIKANCFELQIVWNSHISYDGIANEDYKKELIGRINDLVLSFDRTL